MQLLKHKILSTGEADQLSGLSFLAGGHLRKSASNRRNRLREKQSQIYQHNFIVDLKNFCINLSKKNFDINTFRKLSDSLNLYKKGIDKLDYTLRINCDMERKHILKMFIQNNLPFKYLKLYHYNQQEIKIP